MIKTTATSGEYEKITATLCILFMKYKKLARGALSFWTPSHEETDWRRRQCNGIFNGKILCTSGTAWWELRTTFLWYWICLQIWLPTDYGRSRIHECVFVRRYICCRSHRRTWTGFVSSSVSRRLTWHSLFLKTSLLCSVKSIAPFSYPIFTLQILAAVSLCELLLKHSWSLPTNAVLDVLSVSGAVSSYFLTPNTLATFPMSTGLTSF